MMLQPLVENSIKHGLSQKLGEGRITIRSLREHDHAVIDVIDNGIGIPPVDAGRVKGTGIGLRNVNERLRVIYGANYQLQLDSVPGEGTCARIVIPRDGGRRRGSSHERAASTCGWSSWTTSSWRATSCCFLLEQLGGIEIVAQAGNGVEALRVIEEYQPDLVMLDVQMPGLTGFEVARRRRARPGSSRSWCS